MQHTSLHATLLAEVLDSGGATLNRASLQSLSMGRIAARSKRASTDAGGVITGDNLALHMMLIVLLTRVGGGETGESGDSEFGKSDHFD